MLNFNLIAEGFDYIISNFQYINLIKLIKTLYV